MALAKVVYNAGKEWVARNDVSAATYGLLLIDAAAGYVPDVDADVHVSDISAGELSTTGYTRKTLSDVSLSLNLTDDRAELDASDVSWTAMGTISGPTIDAVILFEDTGDDTTSTLLTALTGVDQALTGGDVGVQFDASGLLRLT